MHKHKYVLNRRVTAKSRSKRFLYFDCMTCSGYIIVPREDFNLMQKGIFFNFLISRPFSGMRR